MMAHAAMARSNLDAFRLEASILDAALPCHDAVASAEDGCRGHRRRLVKVGRHLSILNRAIRKRLVELGRVGRLGVALEGASQCDHQPDVVEQPVSQVRARTRRPGSSRSGSLCGRADRATPGDARAGLLLVPAAKKGAQRRCRDIARDEPGKNQHRMAITGRKTTEQGISPQQGPELVDRAPLAQQQPARRRPDGLRLHSHAPLR